MAKSENYKEFVEKFKPKKTTDDCYTPNGVYAIIRDWVANEYGIDSEKIIRPFWPGEEYRERREELSADGAVVVDNPPFSIAAQIVRDFSQWGVKFFLFAPHLTISGLGNIAEDVCLCIADCSIRYENGAKVKTSFVTNLDEYKIRTIPALTKAIYKFQKDEANRRALPKYDYPDEVVTAARLGKYVTVGVDFRIKAEQCSFVRKLDSQQPHGKTIFGAGYLIAEEKAHELKTLYDEAKVRAAMETGTETLPDVWTLSDREKEIIKSLSR